MFHMIDSEAKEIPHFAAMFVVFVTEKPLVSQHYKHSISSIHWETSLIISSFNIIVT